MTAEHYFSLADTYSLMGDVSRSLPLCLTSCEMRLFPKNLRLIREISQKVRHFTDTDVKSLVIKNDAEKQYFNSIEELYLFYWKEFITGEYVTSPVWKMILERDI